jgi:hypothetical protein
MSNATRATRDRGPAIEGFVSALLLLASTASSLFMMGLIWVIQRVHYPLFRLADPARFPEFHAAHSFHITTIVGPVMGLELLSSWAFVALASVEERAWAMAGALLVIVAWGVTALCSVPAHAKLSAGFDDTAHATLVTTNWLRTVAWSAHAAINVYLVHRRLDALG